MGDKTCEICNLEPAKYKCPTCSIGYCSVSCFKSELHQKSHANPKQNSDRNSPPSVIDVSQNHDEKKEDSTKPLHIQKFEKIVDDPVIRGMLKEHALQFHLLTLVEILDNPNMTGNNNSKTVNSVSSENRMSIMNLKLNDLRIGGIEENSLVEEFISRVLELYGEYDVA